MTRAPLIAAGGVMVLEGLLSGDWFDMLRQEGQVRRENADEARCDDADLSGFRSGNPARFLVTAESGPVLEEIYADRGMIAELEKLSGQALKPTGERGSYSYYDEPGHYLGLHRDIKTCDLTLITCLTREDGDQPSGALRIYPKSVNSALCAIGKDTPHRDVNMEPGQSVILLGGCVPHQVLPAGEGFSRSIAVLCYEMTGTSTVRH